MSSIQFQFPLDDPAPAPAVLKREAIGEHACEVCGGRAAFGYGASYRRNEPGQWFCREHRPTEETQRVA